MSLFSRFLKFVTGLITPKVVVSPTTNIPSTLPADVAIEDVQKAIDIVNNVKNALSSPIAVLITDIIPSTIDDTIRETLVNDLPAVAAGLTFIKTALSSDKSTAINQVLSAIKFSDKPNLDAFYHTLGASVLQIVTGGKVSWSQAVVTIEFVLKEAFLTLIPQSTAAPVAGQTITSVTVAGQTIETAPVAGQTVAQPVV